MSFAKLNLHAPILSAHEKAGYKHPTPIQEQAIPIILTGKDLIGTAQTGTGKTAAFVLPALQMLAETPKQKLPRILILAPVRELANQITDAIHKYSSQSRVKVVSILGGMPYHAQMRQLSQPVDIIVATPGRLIDYLERGNIDLSEIKMFVLDEADRMLDMGFIDDVKHISKHLPKERQTLLFTATLDDRISKLARSLLNSPEHVAVKGKSITLENVEQTAYISDDLRHKNQLLSHILESQHIYKAIIFCATKRHSDKLADQLREDGYSVGVLHGDVPQRKRNQIIQRFRGDLNFLVATDVAARGIDISDVSHVINFDLPRTPEDYVHRIGRTGRAGKKGDAMTFILSTEKSQLTRIQNFIKTEIKQIRVPGLEPKTNLRVTDEKPRGRGGKGRGGSGRHGSSEGSRHGRSGSSHHSKSYGHSEKPKREYGGYRSSGSSAGETKRGDGEGRSRTTYRSGSDSRRSEGNFRTSSDSRNSGERKSKISYRTSDGHKRGGDSEGRTRSTYRSGNDSRRSEDNFRTPSEGRSSGELKSKISYRSNEDSRRSESGHRKRSDDRPSSGFRKTGGGKDGYWKTKPSSSPTSRKPNYKSRDKSE